MALSPGLLTTVLFQRNIKIKFHPVLSRQLIISSLYTSVVTPAHVRFLVCVYYVCIFIYSKMHAHSISLQNGNFMNFVWARSAQPQTCNTAPNGSELLIISCCLVHNNKEHSHLWIPFIWWVNVFSYDAKSMSLCS